MKSKPTNRCHNQASPSNISRPMIIQTQAFNLICLPARPYTPCKTRISTITQLTTDLCHKLGAHQIQFPPSLKTPYLLPSTAASHQNQITSWSNHCNRKLSTSPPKFKHYQKSVLPPPPPPASLPPEALQAIIDATTNAVLENMRQREQQITQFNAPIQNFPTPTSPIRHEHDMSMDASDKDQTNE